MPTTVSVVVATVLAVPLLYMLGTLMVPNGEDWFYARPKSSHNSQWIAEYFRTRVWFYWAGTLFLWATGTTLGAVVAKSYDQSLLAATRRSAEVAWQALPEAAKSNTTFEAFVQKMEELEQRSDARPEWNIARISAELAGATVFCALARMSAVLYHASLMRSMLLGGMGIVGAGIIVVVSLTDSLTAVSASALPTGVNAMVAIGIFIILTSFCGLLTDSILRADWSIHWGRSAGDSVEVAAYTCVIDGKDVILNNIDSETGRGILPKCPYAPAIHRDDIRYNFRRKTSGW